MASRNIGTSAAERGVELTAPTIPGSSEGGGGGGGGGGYSTGSSFAGIENPEALAFLMDYIKQTARGGSDDYKAQRAERNAEIGRARTSISDYTKAAAFQDAADLMAQQLRQSLEKNMPTITKSIQGAGTSASAMQGLLSQKLATESAQAAGALGAQQATSYGQISTALQGVLEALTRIDPSLEQNLIKALDLTRVQRSTQSSVTHPTAPMQPTRSVTASGGGSYWQPFTNSSPAAAPRESFPTPQEAPVQTYYSYAPQEAHRSAYQGQEVPYGGGFIVNSSGMGTTFSGGSAADQFYSPSFDTGYERPEGSTGLEGFTAQSGGSSDYERGYWESDYTGDW